MNTPATAPAPALAWPRLALLRWPLPALLAWTAAWALHALLRPHAGAGVAMALAALLAAASGWWSARPWRRAIVALGFPVSMLLSGSAPVPGWAWLVPLAVLLLAYPARTWRDAPMFPTPAGALNSLPAHVPLAAGARVLDAGCGLGHGLRALHGAYPQAHITGIEWSWPLRLWCGLRCRFAQVRRGDLWQDPWQGLDLVYLFQRPDTMARAMAKAEAEMRPGSWLVSLAFEVPGRRPHASVPSPHGRPVWIYRIGAAPPRDLKSRTGRTDMNLQEPGSPSGRPR